MSEVLQDYSHRVKACLGELHIEVCGEQTEDSALRLYCRDQKDFQFSVLLNEGLHYAEFSWEIRIPQELSAFLASFFYSILEINYKYGCYLSLQENLSEFCLDICTKLYFSGLQYYSCKESLEDLFLASEELTRIFTTNKSVIQGEDDGNQKSDGR